VVPLAWAWESGASNWSDARGLYPVSTDGFKTASV